MARGYIGCVTTDQGSTVNVEVRYQLSNCDAAHAPAEAEWRALEAAGWTVDWQGHLPLPPLRQPLSGPRAASKWFEGSARDARERAVAEWEMITGRTADVWATCDCCPDPHDFVVVEHAAAVADALA